jgi:hypothetical protein
VALSAMCNIVSTLFVGADLYPSELGPLSSAPALHSALDLELVPQDGSGCSAKCKTAGVRRSRWSPGAASSSPDLFNFMVTD